ncbi:MAG: SpoIIE family protein phosphatase [Bacteroidetes bacterium]|nr:SpoIIE family protein phosphatase [Bacteroidota bacterium]
MNITTRIIARLHALSEAAMVLNSTLDLTQILNKNLSYILDILEVDRGTLYLLDPDRQEIWSRIITGDGMEEIRLPYGSGLAGAVAVSGEAIILDDVYQDPRFNPANDQKTGYVTRSMLVLPIMNQQQDQIGVLQLINKRNGVFTDSDQEFAASLAGISAVAIENARLYEESLRSASIKKELSIAREIQSKLIPTTLPDIPGFELAFRYEACSEVGGDYLQLMPLPDGSQLVIIADVSGHGIPAALLVSTLHATVESHLESVSSLEKLAAMLNNLIYRNSTSSTYITFFALILHPDGTFRWLNAGHPSPVLVSGSAATLPFEASGPPLGMLRDMKYEEQTSRLMSGDCLALFTDGITENFNSSEDMFGEEGLGATMIRCQKVPGSDLIESVFQDLNAFTNHAPPDDDRAILVLRKA